MFNKKQTAEIIDKLIELTQHNQIKWYKRPSPPVPPIIGPDYHVDIVYTVNHLGRNIRAYDQHFKQYLDEERYFWDSQMVVEFTDDEGALLGRLPNTPNAYELLRAIQFQNPEIKSFYEDLLRKQL